MPVSGIDHINIRTMDMAASAQFYVEVFDFEYRPEPAIVGRQPNWLYDHEGRPIIHLRIMASDRNSSGPIDHVALNCRGKKQIVERLRSRNIEFAITEDLIPGVTQIFLKDPHGVPLELTFSGE
jgi:catechol 2,3-dioxygenase-like lactoylglutathione lyase family enzyme